MVDGDTTLTDLGVLLEQHRGSLSKREAARRAGISEGRWRQIVTGQQKAGGGIVVPVNPRRETVIAMAQAVEADVSAALRRAGMPPEEATSDPEGMHGTSTSDVDQGTPATMRAIREDPRLIGSAREHLLRQYQLLAQLSDLVGSTEQDTTEQAQTPPVRHLRPERTAARRGKPDKP